MRKLTTKLLLMVATICMVACSTSEKSQPVSNEVEAPATILFSDDNAVLAAYMNIDDLISKCGLTEQQRNLIAAVMISEIEEADARDYVQGVIQNLDNSGIKFSEPVYATVNMGICDDEVAFEGVLVAEVSNVDTLDMLVEKMDLPINSENGVRYYNNSDDEIFWTAGYNSKYFVLAFSSEDVSNELFRNTLKNADINLSVFKDRDIAIYMDMGKLIAFYEQILDMGVRNYQEIIDYSNDYYEVIDAEYMLEDYYEQIQQVDIMKEYVGTDVKSVIGLTFKEGRIVLDMEYTGGNDKYLDMYKSVNDNQLKYIPRDAIAIANIGVNGPAIANFVKDVFNNDMIDQLASNLDMSKNDFSSFLMIFCDAISSINGDVTMALNSLDIYTKEVYDWYYDEYYDETVVAADALVMADVTNSYIMDNLSLIPDFKRSANGRGYYMNIDNDKINIGQLDNTLYLGWNVSCDKPLTNSIESKWAGEFDNSIAYLAVDVQNASKLSIVEELIEDIYYTEGYQAAEAVESTINLFDSAWFNIRKDKKAELVITMKDGNTNALAQLLNHAIRMAQ